LLVALLIALPVFAHDTCETMNLRTGETTNLRNNKMAPRHWPAGGYMMMMMMVVL